MQVVAISIIDQLVLENKFIEQVRSCNNNNNAV